MFYNTNTKTENNNAFTYIIRSVNKENAIDYTNNCSIRLHGLPQKYKYFDCTVSALHVSTNASNFTTSTFELKADGIDIINGRDTTNNMLKSIAFASYNNTYPQGTYSFRCENFNGRSCKFQLCDDSNNLLTYSSNSNLVNFNGTFTYVGAATSLVIVSSVNSSSVYLQVGQIIYNFSGIVGTVNGQSSAYSYTVTTALTASISSTGFYTTNSTVNYNKPWILILNMVGIE